MNVFLLDSDIQKAVRYMCDRHIVKMPVESAQMLCTAHQYYGSYHPSFYGISHLHHPWTIWTRRTNSNYQWHFQLFMLMCQEYRRRFHRVHEVDWLLTDALSQPPELIALGDLTEFPLTMPVEYRQSDPVQSYRDFYIGHKLYFARWRYPGITPDWVVQQLVDVFLPD